MKKLSAWLMILFVCNLCFCTNLVAETWYQDKPEDIHIIKEDISILNLVNALDLTKEQIRDIIQFATEAQKEKVRFERKIKNDNKAYKAALTQLKHVLAQGLSIPKGVEQKVHVIEKNQHITTSEFYQSIKSIQEQLIASLNAEQIYVIDDFQPCVIPPKDLTNPMRAGQSGSNIAEIEKLIKDLRELPPDIFSYFSHKVLDQIITETELVFGKLSEENRVKEKNRLMKIVTDARNMSDLDFSVEKKNMAKQFIKRSDNVVTKLNNFSELESEMHGGITKIGKFLLNPQIIPLLKPRLNKDFKVQIEKKIIQNQSQAQRKGEPKKDVPFNEFSRILTLSNSQRNKISKCLVNGQQNLWKTLMLPRKDRINIIKKIEEIEKKTNQTEGFNMSLMDVLSLKVPKTKKTYFEAMVTIQEEMEGQLKRILSTQQYNRYKQANISLFDVKL